MRAALILILMTLGIANLPASADTRLQIASFNVESDPDTRPELVAEDLRRLPGIDLWALQEVENETALNIFIDALNQTDNQLNNGSSVTYDGFIGQSGARWRDRLAFVYRTDQFQTVQFVENDAFGGSRDALIMTAKLADGTPLTFVNHHFNRGDAERRQRQAYLYRTWLASQPDRAIISIGDFNFDYQHLKPTPHGNPAFEEFMSDGLIDWPAPACIAARTCPQTGSQCNPRYRNILDFFFLSGPARNWRVESDLAFLDENYCQRDWLGYADHRPLLAIIHFE